jgi:sugar phosphate isomerase/epimerase
MAKTLEKVAKIGYKNIQVSGFGPMPAEAVAKAAKDNGLNIVSTHTGWPKFQTELDSVIADHKLWNCKHPAVGGIPGTYHSEEGLKKLIAELKPIVKKLAEAGMDFSYHNHDHELMPCGGKKTWLERLYEETTPAELKVEIDTHWIQAGGGDPAQWIRKYSGRQPILHLKDMTMAMGVNKEGRSQKERRFSPIGSGNMNWDSILKAAEDAGVEYMCVEQDNCYGMDPFEALAISFRFLSGRGYK